MILLRFNIVSPINRWWDYFTCFSIDSFSLSRILEESYFWLFREAAGAASFVEIFPWLYIVVAPLSFTRLDVLLPPMCLSHAFRRLSYRLAGCQGGYIEWDIKTFADRLLRRDVGQLGRDGQILTNTTIKLKTLLYIYIPFTVFKGFHCKIEISACNRLAYIICVYD